MATASLVLGICAVLPGLGIILGVIALILGIITLSDKRGIRGHAIAGVVLGAVFGVGQLVALPLVLLPALNRARELAKRAMCGANLNGIGKAMSLYAASYRDEFPPDYQTLLKDHLVTERSFMCPSVPPNKPVPHYFFFPPKDGNSASGDAMMVCDFRDNHRGEFRNVLLVSGYILQLTEAQFQARLALPMNAKFAAALRQAERP